MKKIESMSHKNVTNTPIEIKTIYNTKYNQICNAYAFRLRHSKNADKKFQQYNRLNFSNHPIRYSTETTTVIWISTQPISNYYGDTENVITF